MTIPIEAIIAKEWAQVLEERSGGDGIINYAIIEKAGEYSRRNFGVSDAEANAIRETFTEIDSLTGIAFAESRPEEANILLYSVRKYKGGFVGLAEDNGSQYVATWKDYGGKRLTAYELSTIKHEIGHTLGLDHPYGDGDYKGITTRDTLMSYNEPEVVTEYSKTDIEALQFLWGAPT